jgi:hypothetical protein
MKNLFSLLAVALFIFPFSTSAQSTEELGVCIAEDTTTCNYAYVFEFNENETHIINDNLVVSANLSMENGSTIQIPQNLSFFNQYVGVSPSGENYHLKMLFSPSFLGETEINCSRDIILNEHPDGSYFNTDSVFVKLLIEFSIIIDGEIENVIIETTPIKIPNSGNLTVGLNENRIKSDFNGYPNPFSTNLTIESDEVATLHDITGKTLLSYDPKLDDNVLETSHLPAGMYFLRKDGGKEVMRLMKQ